MASTKFALEPGGPKRLEITSGAFWTNVNIRLDDVLVGQIPSKSELIEGRSFPLSDGSELHVKLAQSFGSVELQVTRNGKPLPGSTSDPATRVATAGYIIYFIAALNAFVGIPGLIFSGASGGVMRFGAALARLFEQIGFSWINLVEGAVFALLGFLTLRRSKPALIAAIGLFVVDGVFNFAGGLDGKGDPPVGLMFVRVILGLAMIRGVPAIDELKKADDEAAKKPPAAL